ncbi:MAG: hypothetical protein VB111_07210 [Clostridiaceae bacterium]|nr:hypothetical protein [Clostridiaceae bacterium]
MFTVDEENSDWYPEPGDPQRFSYTVEAVGEGGSTEADLSHWVLGICDTITEDDLEDVTVTIDGVPQEVEIGVNVEIVTDPTTGCRGLKFDFGLNKEDGEMRVTFSLAQDYPIGPNMVCIAGGQQVLTGQSICGPVCEGECFNCEGTYGFQSVEVCVPVTVTPRVTPGTPEVTCCGEAVSLSGPCPDTGSPSCVFHVTQRLCVAVPLTFNADAVTGDPQVICAGDCDGDVD